LFCHSDFHVCERRYGMAEFKIGFLNLNVLP
jgi:hypothetical protein